jgi:predicted TIM-barrel fold metal-dependent hydrolase
MRSPRAAASIAASRTSTKAITDAELERLHAGGIRGIRFNFVQHLGGTPDLDEFDRLVQRVVPLGWHVVLHFDAKDLLEFDDCCASCRCRSSSITWAACRRRTGWSRSRSASC